LLHGITCAIFHHYSKYFWFSVESLFHPILYIFIHNLLRFLWMSSNPDLKVKKMCTTILPWGKYQYKRLLIGVKTSPDIFQRIMYELLGDIPNIQVYLDDIIITSNGTFEEHTAIIK
jgi:hypothetical protein